MLKMNRERSEQNVLRTLSALGITNHRSAAVRWGRTTSAYPHGSAIVLVRANALALNLANVILSCILFSILYIPVT